MQNQRQKLLTLMVPATIGWGSAYRGDRVGVSMLKLARWERGRTKTRKREEEKESGREKCSFKWAGGSSRIVTANSERCWVSGGFRDQ